MIYYMWTATGMQETGERLWGDYVERREAEARIAELEDKLSGKSAEVQSKLVEQEARIAELVAEVEYWKSGAIHDEWDSSKLKPKENEE